MTLIFQNMATSKNAAAASGGKTADSGKTTTGTMTEGNTFGQTLVHQMSNAGTPTVPVKDMAAFMLNASVQMLKDLPAPSEGENTASKELVGPAASLKQENSLDLGLILMFLLKDLEKLEEALKKDPSLLKEIQVWLMQALAMLNGVQGQGPSADQQQLTEGEVQTLSPLASNPETVRFAVQDALTQLSDMLKSMPSSEQSKPQLVQLVQSFQALLNENGKGAAKEASEGQTRATSPVITQVDGETEAAVDKKELPANLKPASETSKVSETTVKVTSQVKEGTLAEESAEGKSASITEPDSNMITAGQLALRSGTTAPVKPMAQPVPVEQFAKEMTNLVVNKLEFVKLQGFTEARISLNPEHLGQVDIKITMQNGQLIAQFMTRNSDARELLDQQMSQLRSALQGQGLQVEKLEVTQSSQSSSSQLYQDGRQPGSGQQDSNRRSREKDVPSDDTIAAAAITEEWNEWLAEREADEEQGHGGTFTAKI